MNLEPNELVTAPGVRAPDATRDNLRGSTLLLAGRVVAVAINFVIHVMIVRYLAQTDYGALAFAASVVSVGSSIAVFGMNKTMARFVPIYEERGDYDRFFGALAVGFGIMIGLSVAMVLLFYGLSGLVGRSLVQNELALAILMITVVNVPIQALDNALLGLFAIFGDARMIFWRRHIAAPLLYLGVVLLAITGGYDVFFLAAASVIVGGIGLAIYAAMLLAQMRRRGLFERLNPRSVRLPAREMLGFSLPLLSTDVVFMLRGAVLVIILGAMAGVEQVALFSAVSPIASQNMLVLDSFRLLFMPAAARLYARDDEGGIDHLYWQTAIWVAMLTLPILLLSVALAQPVAILLFGDAYRDSALVLAVLGVGYYVNACFGFNGLTLRVFGRVRYLVIVDAMTAMIGIAAAIPLISMFGALGAAAAVTLIFVAQNAFYQVGLQRTTPVSGFARTYAPVYLGIPVAAGLLIAIQSAFAPPLWGGVGAAGLIALVFFLLNRRLIRLGEIFPELYRLPLARIFLG